MQQRQSAEAFWARMTLPEEERRCQLCPPTWNGSYRWFRSANIVNLWNYRGVEDKRRIIEFMWRRQLRPVCVSARPSRS